MSVTDMTKKQTEWHTSHGKDRALSIIILHRTGNKYQPKCGDALQLGVKAGWLIPHTNLSTLEISITHIIKHYKNVLLTLFHTHLFSSYQRFFLGLVFGRLKNCDLAMWVCNAEEVHSGRRVTGCWSGDLAVQRQQVQTKLFPSTTHQVYSPSTMNCCAATTTCFNIKTCCISYGRPM